MQNAKDITVENLKLNILIYGPSGVGKTEFGCSFIDAGSVFVCDFDNGMLGQRGKDIDYTRFTNYADFDCWLQEEEANPTHDTIVLDSITTLQEVKMDHLINIAGRKLMTLAEWNVLIADLKDLFMRITAIARNVVVVAHQQLVQDEITGEIFVLPLIVGKKMPALLPLWFDEVYHMGVAKDNTGTPVYYFDTVAQDKYMGKSRLSVLPSRVEWSKPNPDKPGRAMPLSAYGIIRGHIEGGG